MGARQGHGRARGRVRRGAAVGLVLEPEALDRAGLQEFGVACGGVDLKAGLFEADESLYLVAVGVGEDHVLEGADPDFAQARQPGAAAVVDG